MIEMEQKEQLPRGHEASSLLKNAQLFKALGDETRLRMMGLLKHGELCVCDLMEVLDLPQSTASRHLSYLKNSEWVVGRRSGRWMYYKLHPDVCNSHLLNSIIEHISILPDLQKDYEKLVTYLEKKSNSTQCS
jgi:ArsR family transcriptional regulator